MPRVGVEPTRACAHMILSHTRKPSSATAALFYFTTFFLLVKTQKTGKLKAMKVISVVNQKGGVGKTNLATNLSAYLSFFERKVLLIDFDPQANATSGFGVEKNRKGIYEILNQEISFGEGVLEIKKNLFLIPANEDLVGATIEWVNKRGREEILKRMVESYSSDFDFVFIDTPPSLGILTVNSLAAADSLLVPVQAEYYALEGLSSLLKIKDLVKSSLRPELEILGAVITMYDKRSQLSKEVFEELYQHFEESIFRTVIPRNVKLAEAPSFGKSILDYAPDSSGGRAYKRLAKEFLIKISNF